MTFKINLLFQKSVVEWWGQKVTKQESLRLSFYATCQGNCKGGGKSETGSHTSITRWCQ